jgi:hypothetical protein
MITPRSAALVEREPARDVDHGPVTGRCFNDPVVRYATAMLYTILIVLAIVALLMFIFGYRRV